MKRIYFLISMFIVAIAISAYFIKERFFAPPRIDSCFDSYDRRIDCTTRQLIEGNPTGTGGGARTYGGSDGLYSTSGQLGDPSKITPTWDSGYLGGSSSGTGSGSGTGQIVAPRARLSTTTTVRDAITYLTDLLNVGNILKARLSANPTRVPTLTPQDITILGSDYLGNNPSTATFSTILITVEKSIEETRTLMKTITDTIREGKLTNNDTLLTGIPKLLPDQATNVNTIAQYFINEINPAIEKSTIDINILIRITQPLPSNPPPPSGTGQIVAPRLTVSRTTKVSDAMAYLTALLTVGNTIKRRLSSTPTRVPTLTPQDIDELGNRYFGENPSTTTFGRILETVEREIEDLNFAKTTATNMLREGKITNNDTILTGIPKLFPDIGSNVNELAQSYITGGNDIIGRITTKINILNRITQPLPSNPPPPVNPNPGGANAEADVDSSGNYLDGSGNIVRINLNDLLGAITSPSFNDKKNEKDDKIRIPTPVKPVETPCLDQYYSILKPQIQKDISTAIHDEFARVTAPPNSIPITTPATQQGCSMQETQQQQQDMSQYIRKDSIPCWNCSGF